MSCYTPATADEDEDIVEVDEVVSGAGGSELTADDNEANEAAGGADGSEAAAADDNAPGNGAGASHTDEDNSIMDVKEARVHFGVPNDQLCLQCCLALISEGDIRVHDRYWHGAMYIRDVLVCPGQKYCLECHTKLRTTYLFRQDLRGHGLEVPPGRKGDFCSDEAVPQATQKRYMGWMWATFNQNAFRLQGPESVSFTSKLLHLPMLVLPLIHFTSPFYVLSHGYSAS
jgi:hypothetical protein